MSTFGEWGWRCDVCGKFTRDKSREYLRVNGEAGYIMPDDECGGDICTDCIEAELSSMEVFVSDTR